jgi:hypothetical protein
MASAKKSEDCKNGASCKHYSAGKCLFRHPVMKRVQPKQQLKQGPSQPLRQKMSNHAKLSMLRNLGKRREALEKATASLKPAAAPQGWALVPDTKATVLVAPDTVALMKEAYEAEVKMVRGVLASAYGSKPVDFVLPVTTTFASTVTTGVVSTPLPIVITDSPEFTSLAALFDEYRFVSGRYDYVILTPTPTVVIATSSLTVNSNAVIGFDPSDNTTPTDVRDVLQLEYHLQKYPRMIATPTLGTYVGVYGDVENRPYRFNWSYKDDAAFTGNGGAVGPGQWKSTAGNVSSFPDGSLKPYYLTGESTAKTTFTGVMYWTVHFRNRT